MGIMTIALVLLLIFFISVIWPNAVGAPWVPTSMENVHKMLTLADVKPGDTVYDLGCGDGRTIITAARRYKAQAVGIEVDPFRYIWCQIVINLLGLRNQVKVIYGNFFNQDLSKADVVTCYLLPETNTKLEEKFHRELHPGTRVVSNTFVFNTVPLAEQKGNIRLYHFPPNTPQSI
jgi:SAM-dependent methyltransferase